MVPIYNGISLSHKKERNWVVCRDVDGPRDCHTEWSKSEGEKQISYINASMWNLEEWYIWASLQDRNRDTDVETNVWTPREESGGGSGGWDELGDWVWHIYTYMYSIDT